MFQPTDGRRLACFRILFGLLMVWEVWRYFDHGWVERYYIEPEFFFTYYGFDWVRPWGGMWMKVHFVVLGVLATFIALGFLYRWSMALFFVGFAHIFLIDQTNYLNHFYFITLLSFLMILAPAHRQLSIDAWLRPNLRSQVIPVWSLWMLRLQIGIVYFYGGLAKLNSDWLGGQPMGMWLSEYGDVRLVGVFFETTAAAYLFSYGGLLLDLFIFPMLLWRRTLPFAFLLATAFHLMNAALFNIGIFPWMMIATLVLFLPASRDALPHRQMAFNLTKLLAALLAIFFVFQLLMPLRHHLYASDVKWSEEGHLFSWRMKLNDREATHLLFVVSDAEGGLHWEVNLEDYLTRRQIHQMSTRPDMILQFAHYVGNLVQSESEADFAELQVQAQVLVSLNGREPAWLIDPDANLLAEPRDLTPADWILPSNGPVAQELIEEGR